MDILEAIVLLGVQEEVDALTGFTGIKASSLKKAYRKKAKESHPDKIGGDVEVFKSVALAYSTVESALEGSDFLEASKYSPKLGIMAIFEVYKK